MKHTAKQEQAVELLQELGLKEYESKAFVALTRFSSATAKEISDHSEVPRTRVYDAVRVLESKGLVEIQHSSPQLFRAVSVQDGAEILRTEYESRADSLEQLLQQIEPIEGPSEKQTPHEVWSFSGSFAIQKRTESLLRDTEEEVMIVIGDSGVFTEDLAARLGEARQRGATVIVGTVTETLREEVQSSLPDAEVFLSELRWLSGGSPDPQEVFINRLLLVDQSTILLSTVHKTEQSQTDERAVFGRGFDNGLVVLARRLMATGLLPGNDPE